MPDRNFTFQIEEHLGTISKREREGEGGWSKELNLIRWNGAAAKYDIREWDEHHEHMSKGITLSPWEMNKMVDLFVSKNNDAAVARGRALEAERNARRITARQRAAMLSSETEAQESQSAIEEMTTLDAQMEQTEPFEQVEPMEQVEVREQVEQETLEGATPPEGDF